MSAFLEQMLILIRNAESSKEDIECMDKNIDNRAVYASLHAKLMTTAAPLIVFMTDPSTVRLLTTLMNFTKRGQNKSDDTKIEDPGCMAGIQTLRDIQQCYN
jgi:hypothetical protein